MAPHTSIICRECGKVVSVPDRYVNGSFYGDLLYAGEVLMWLVDVDLSLVCTDCLGYDEEEIWSRKYRWAS